MGCKCFKLHPSCFSCWLTWASLQWRLPYVRKRARDKIQMEVLYKSSCCERPVVADFHLGLDSLLWKHYVSVIIIPFSLEHHVMSLQRPTMIALCRTDNVLHARHMYGDKSQLKSKLISNQTKQMMILAWLLLPTYLPWEEGGVLCQLWGDPSLCSLYIRDR